MRKIYVVGLAEGYSNWMEGTITRNMDEADLVVFTGGEDVDPNMYNEPKNRNTGSNITRDMREAKEFNKAVALGKPIIGICRGSQFTCAMSKGRLIQHQENPHYIHNIITSDGEVIPITSTHHQAMYPYDMPKEDYKVLGWTNGISKFHQDGNGNEISNKPFDEVEICYFPKTKVLGIQGHPEVMSPQHYSKTITYLRNLLNNHLENKL